MTRKRRRRGIHRLRWTPEEDRRLIQLISENSGNIRNAFKTFTEEYPERTFKATEFRWYKTLKNNPNTNVCMLTIDKRHKYINGKNIGMYTKSSSLRISIWNKILNLLFGRK